MPVDEPGPMTGRSASSSWASSRCSRVAGVSEGPPDEASQQQDASRLRLHQLVSLNVEGLRQFLSRCSICDVSASLKSGDRRLTKARKPRQFVLADVVLLSDVPESIETGRVGYSPLEQVLHDCFHQFTDAPNQFRCSSGWCRMRRRPNTVASSLG
jgi:hypothetical protein